MSKPGKGIPTAGAFPPGENMQVEVAYLHSPIMLSGQTEATLSVTKIRGLTMEWIPGPFLVARCKGKVHVIPSAAVKDTILAGVETPPDAAS